MIPATSGTHKQVAAEQFMAEMRLKAPKVYIPTKEQREAGWLMQYYEIYEVFKDLEGVYNTQ